MNAIEIRTCHDFCTAEDHALLAVQLLQAQDLDRACDELCAALKVMRDLREARVLEPRRGGPVPVSEVMPAVLEQLAARVGG